MIAQAAIAALLTTCTLVAWKAVTVLDGKAKAVRRRSADADAVTRAVAAGAASVPDPVTTQECSRQRHEQLVVDLRERT
ncbi:hypothetical protein [Catenulispora pinisilvae]|uniref:hypothetical protein n=1 Tax=Catenulispora pinisilvae TaxID=2705253 RepID=UPI001890B7E0|nr:hypothetical protein [Catenulispora pinisilvae]